MVMVVTQMASPPTFNEIRVDFVSHGGGFVSHGGEPSLGRCPAGKMLKLLLGGCRKGKGDHGNPDEAASGTKRPRLKMWVSSSFQCPPSA